MCATCGCGGEAKPSVLDLQTGQRTPIEPPAHEHVHADGTRHSHSHEHDHDHNHGHGNDHGHGGTHQHGTTVALEARILAKNDALAQQNRGWFRGREILALNLVSAPGAGKTTLLERTIRDLRDKLAALCAGGRSGDRERRRAHPRGRRAGRADQYRHRLPSRCDDGRARARRAEARRRARSS